MNGTHGQTMGKRKGDLAIDERVGGSIEQSIIAGIPSISSSQRQDASFVIHV
jgi:hypothetical protein